MQDLPIILFGAGGVGRALIRLIATNRSLHAIQYGLYLRVMALCDRDGAVIEPSTGIEDEVLLELAALKEAGGRLADHALGGSQADLAGIVDIAGQAGTVVVDCTASDQTESALLFALNRRYKLVLANKKPLSMEQDLYDRLVAGEGTVGELGDRVRHIGRCRWETTVGAGLPILATLERLLSGGDAVTRIAGTFSGTLGYVMTGLEQGRAFSEIVREAHHLGYTEPDPRDDLGGIDVARKALILARGLGWKLELDAVAVEGLYPPEMDNLTVEEFLDQTIKLDTDLARQVRQAGTEGKALRYAATVQDGACRVGPVLVEANSPLGRLRGTDNLIEFYTRCYNPSPLVVQGRGAGTDVTAAGVLSDIVEMAFAA